MCGIAGFAGSGEAADLQRMTRALAHRGPDAEGLWSDAASAVFLGHRRLSIIDVGGGSQPMWTRDGTLGVVFNGEIYNHADLRKELQAAGRVFQSDHSDTEVLLHGYAEWGTSLCERLDGMWAFVIYDRKENRLFGSRDPFGKKPLCYHRDGRGFRFASELSGLTEHPAVSRELCETALQKYFAYGYIPGPRCIYRDVWKLRPGSWFTYELGTGAFREQAYWEFLIEPETEQPSPAREAAWAEEIRELLRASVRRRLMSDVPLGVFLSGGIDSSAIAALAAAELPAGSLQTFCIGFEQPSFDESAFARAASQAIGTTHHEEMLDLDAARALLPDIVSKLDEPMGDSSILPTTLLSRFARQRVKVALGGDGGDELFAGYDPFRAIAAADLYEKLVPRPLHRGIRLLASRLPVSAHNISFDFKIKRTLRGLSYPGRYRAAVWMGPLEPAEIAELVRKPVDPEELYSEAIEAWESTGAGAHTVDRTLQFFTRLYLRDGILVKADRASMMHSLEVRSPFLDAALVDRVRRIPWRSKLRGNRTKHILKLAMETVVPDSVLQRPKKGFGAPVGKWFTEGVMPESEPIAELDEGFARRAMAAHRAGTADERLFLWNWWLLCQWRASREG